MSEPRYRIGRRATDAELWQWFINCLRRLFFLPIKKTSEQRKQEVLANEGETMRVDLVIIIAALVASAVLAHTAVSWLALTTL